ncbi:MAG: helix-turn-helix transcriptional regulator [Bifidobacterium thermacidophilum]|jgi:transcriptional regulator with XRE-family HTH domain|uniref:helix-turn-helix domain-containing protein n=1 Tax=Bifidobacterium thermacidophilum TaxID=246618 RepID=UPI002F35F40B
MPTENNPTSEKWRAESFESLIGTSIHLQRDAVGMSQKELAKKLSEYGFSIQQSAIAKIENGTRPLRVSELVAIAQALGVPWQSLLLAGENYASFAKDPAARLQQIIDGETLMANAMMESEMKRRREFMERYTRTIGSIRAAEQLIGRLKLTSSQDIAKAVAEIIHGINGGSKTEDVD